MRRIPSFLGEYCQRGGGFNVANRKEYQEYNRKISLFLYYWNRCDNNHCNILFYYGGGDRAGNILSFAATLSSILLAFIAILMTIVDLGGQRNTIADLKESADKLDRNLITTNEGIQEISALKEELMSSMRSIINSNLEMSKEITSLKEKYSIDESLGDDNKSFNNVDILQDLETLNERMSNLYMKNINSKYEERRHHALEDFQMKSYIRAVLGRTMKQDTDYELDDIYAFFKNSSKNVSRSGLKKELNNLVNSGKLERGNNRYYRIVK